jgi:hypothetical protein
MKFSSQQFFDRQKLMTQMLGYSNHASSSNSSVRRLPKLPCAAQDQAARSGGLLLLCSHGLEGIEFYQSGIMCFLLQQFSMRSLFDDGAVFHNHNPIGPFDG